MSKKCLHLDEGCGKGCRGDKKEEKGEKRGCVGLYSISISNDEGGMSAESSKERAARGGGLFLCIDVNKLSVRIKGYAKLATHTDQAIMLL